ncbi:hypothetical protein A8924_7144 [Saccharopolyspora erythraea NRRL 2338]|uniref:PE-PGRS family protein n=2 Tax=Saccharopolyspora erythraea TaxID=1836 RepID=A4FPH6_SACEN|nr:hypothetical protein [Saccharopolyspora erythraea]EQD84176.1 hypothetical protein N599_21390 [Saccharopolyspora erythraea D]PFG99594.1 hypothetical protein A8924_7144 [Saccharopolyspora erythraea NRRL 2338]QRK89487.1 hypothetical protein JQX30_33955 [Saccharopolyspora erythraea]CAM05951.1 PE-PGRS family protein [Saccharopolyspora erythraea NRRL 2338]
MDNPFKAVADGAYDMYQSFTGGNTRAQQADIVAQKAALAAAEKGRADLAAKQRGLEVAGTDPASIQQHDNWKEWDHQRLATQLKESLKPDDIQASGRAWAKLGEEIAEVFADLDKQARDAAGDGMRGQAADAGLNAAQPLQQWGQSFGDSVRMTGLKVQEAGLAAEQTKASIQPPNEGGTARSLLAGGMGGMTGGGFAMMDAAMQMKERSEDEKRARAIAENVYSPGYTAVDGSTPSLPPPVDPLNPPPPPPPPPGRSNIPAGQDPSVSGQTPGRAFNPSGTTPGGSNPGGIGSGGGAPNLPSVDSPAGSGSQWADQPRTPAFPPNGPVPGGPGVPGSQPPGAFVTGPGPGGGPTAGGGAGAGRGGMGSGVGARAGGGPGVGAGGRAGAGGLGAGAGAAGGVGAKGAGGAGGRGAGGAMGGGAGAGRGGETGDDLEHERPSWLIEDQDVWTDGMPRTAPPVFGE